MTEDASLLDKSQMANSTDNWRERLKIQAPLVWRGTSVQAPRTCRLSGGVGSY